MRTNCATPELNQRYKPSNRPYRLSVSPITTLTITILTTSTLTITTLTITILTTSTLTITTLANTTIPTITNLLPIIVVIVIIVVIPTKTTSSYNSTLKERG